MLHTFEQEDEARLLEDVLFAVSIKASVAEGRTGTSFLLWVHDDGDLERSKEILAEFLAAPTDPRFVELRRDAKKTRKKAAAADKKSRHKVVRGQAAFGNPRGLGPFTVGVIGVCVLAAVITSLGDNRDTTRYFYFVYPLYQIAHAGSATLLLWDSFLECMQSGQVWRLLSPAFLHLSFLHIVFNLMWWKDLAGALEKIRGTAWLVGFFLVSALVGNFAEYFLGSPLFGGLSGVVYALFGYLWIRGRYDPTFPAAIPRYIVMWMMAWYLFCLSGLMPVANWGHTGGLVVGAVWGLLDSRFIQRKLMRPDHEAK